MVITPQTSSLFLKMLRNTLHQHGYNLTPPCNTMRYTQWFYINNSHILIPFGSLWIIKPDLPDKSGHRLFPCESLLWRELFFFFLFFFPVHVEATKCSPLLITLSRRCHHEDLKLYQKNCFLWDQSVNLCSEEKASSQVLRGRVHR